VDRKRKVERGKNRCGCAHDARLHGWDGSPNQRRTSLEAAKNKRKRYIF
jgi:hypothetical protein